MATNLLLDRQSSKRYNVEFQQRPNEEAQTVEVGVYRDHANDLLLVEQDYRAAKVVTEFAILEPSTVRAEKPLSQYPDFVLKAVVAAGFDSIEPP